MAPAFSVVVPTRDRPGLLGEAVASVLRQTVGDLELLVVDDGGRVPLDLPPDPRVRLLRHDTSAGVAAARNTGLAHARGDAVAFLDDDDVWLPHRLELAYDGLARSPVAVCAGTTTGGPAGRHRPLFGDVAGTILDRITPNLGQTAVVRRLAPRLDERFAAVEDVEWWLRAARTLPVTSTDRVGFVYRRHGGARQGNGRPERIAASRLLLGVHRDYFAGHPRAHAFRLFRLGLMEAQEGDRAAARRDLNASLRVRPSAGAAAALARLALARGRPVRPR